MFKELKDICQVQGEPLRRCFLDPQLDLTIWYNKKLQIVGFQLTYNHATPSERVLTWLEKSGFTHDFLDDGESRPYSSKATPILMKDGYFPYHEIAQQFQEQAKELEPEIAHFVYEKLLEFPIVQKKNLKA